MSSAKPKRLPGDVRHLQRLVSTVSKEQGIPPVRLQRWLNAMVVTAVLDRVRDENDEPIFLVKGGVAMELRLRLRARTTKDFDAAFRARTEEVLERLDQALAEPWNAFSLTRSEATPIKNTKALRLNIQLRYKVRSWGTVTVELAPVEGKVMGTELDRVPAVPLEPLQVPVPEQANCVSLRYQVAQKLHACTEVFDEGPENDRFRDIMDVLLVEDLLRKVGLHRVRAACMDIFEVRAKHAWPPTITVYESWREPFAALARENGFTPEDVEEAAALLDELIAAIDAATEPADAAL